MCLDMSQNARDFARIRPKRLTAESFTTTMRTRSAQRGRRWFIELKRSASDNWRDFLLSTWHIIARRIGTHSCPHKETNDFPPTLRARSSMYFPNMGLCRRLLIHQSGQSSSRLLRRRRNCPGKRRSVEDRTHLSKGWIPFRVVDGGSECGQDDR